MTVRVRFAPSPTGRLHLGNARGALINWLFARRHDGIFLLRLDNTDTERSTKVFALGIETDLHWLGLTWDEFARQSDRFGRYAEAVDRLKEMGRLYPCYETAEELEARRFRQVAGGGVQVYDRTALRLSDAQKKAYEAEGRKPHWRFLLNPAEVAWTDAIRGPVSFHGARLSDPVLVRADGTPIYTLASVVDDIEFDITHIIRGEDHVSNTAVQLQLFEALGRAPASLTFAHFSLLTDAGGHNLSKRLGSLSIGALRSEGIEAMAVNSLLARLGTSDPVEAKARIEDLIPGFDLDKFSRAAPKLDLDELKRLNAKLLHDMPFAEVRARLAALDMPGVDEAFWLAVRPNIATIKEAGEWWRICHEPVAPVLADAGLASRAADLLPPEPWTEATWGEWTKAVAAATGRKGRDLFMPLRLALTAREHGPELKSLLPIIGRNRAAARLSGKAA
ncbi:MAG: glutamate--tRNA ligase [Rhodospirillales bacterium]|nr:glutamate--tRNA ligase [Rhodospirillales bacterium]